VGKDKLVDIAMELLESGEDTTGVCLKCAEEQGCVEPDASGYKCEACGERAVMGAEEIILTFGGF